MPDDLYSRDIVAWSKAQAERLRRVAAGEKVNDLDWANVIEEIESVGRSETTAVESFLSLALLHALKVIAWPGHSAERKWRNEIGTFLSDAQDRFVPSMAQAIDLPALYRRTLNRFRRLDMGRPPGPVPETLRLTLTDLLDEALTPEGLVARMSAG